MSEIPRDPEFYHPSDHAVQQAKYRNIDWVDVAKTIQEGEIKATHKDNCHLFIKEFHYTDKPVGVVANTKQGKIITVEFRK